MRKQNSRTVDKEGVVWKCADFGAVFVSLSPIQPQNLHASAQLLPYKLSCPAPPPYTSNKTSFSQIAGQWIRKELCGSAHILGLSSSPSPTSNPKICTLPHNSILINCPVPHHHRTRPTPLPPTTCHESFGWRRSHFFGISVL